MKTGEPTFMTLVLLDKIADPQAAIDDYVSAWHDADDPVDPDGRDAIDLHHYLGMSWADYGQWVTNPDALPTIIAAARLRWNNAIEGTNP